MKTFKKLASILLTVAMVMSLGITASAANSVNITVNNPVDGATYSGYKLLDATTSLKVENCHATDAGHKSECYNIAYSVNDKYLEILKDVTHKTTRREIIDYIGGLTGSATAIQGFADDVYGKLTSVAADEPDMTANFSVDSGYWLIVEKIADADYDGAYSLVMLDTAGAHDIDIDTKRVAPTVTKAVSDDGITYGPAVDLQIGDTAYYQLEATVPNPLGYASYTYVIHDQASAGLDININSIEVKLNDINGTVLTPANNYQVTSGSDCTDGCTFHIQVNIKNDLLKEGDILYITYQAKLNEQANIFASNDDLTSANPNTVWLEYSNNPYNDGENGETAITTESVVYVWTFYLNVNKVDAAGTALQGAKFVLSKDGTLTEDQLKSPLADDVIAKLIPLIADNGTYTVAPTDYEGAVVYEISAGTAKINGFKDLNQYYLYEIAAPAGYNKLDVPVKFQYSATYTEGQPTLADEFPTVSIDGKEASQVLEANVVNNTGTVLPSTGGTGTTIFFALGGGMVLVAIILLITKKRMGKES